MNGCGYLGHKEKHDSNTMTQKLKERPENITTWKDFNKLTEYRAYNKIKLVKLDNACPPCKQYYRHRMHSNGALLALYSVGLLKYLEMEVQNTSSVDVTRPSCIIHWSGCR